MKKNKKKLIFIFTGKRGGFSHFIPIIKQINKSKFLDYRIVASDMHLSSFFGKTINEIKLHTKKIIKLKANIIRDKVTNRLSVISNNIDSLSKVFKKKKPNYFIVLGDRAEVLGASIASQFFNIPILHMYGGDITQGGTDEPTRHAITKLSNLHLTSNKASSNNVRQLGEEKWRIFNIGLTSIDLFNKKFFRNEKYLEKKYNINFKLPFIILLQHPVTWESKQSYFQINETLKAIDQLKIQTLAIYPCSDPGYKNIIDAYKKFKKKSYFRLFKNIESQDFYSLLNYASILVGNSSCGITECGYLKKNVINIGTRQEGRLSDKNVFNVEHNSKKIKKLILKLLSFKVKPKQSLIYGNGKSAQKIVKILLTNLNKDKLIKKKFQILQ